LKVADDLFGAGKHLLFSILVMKGNVFGFPLESVGDLLAFGGPDVRAVSSVCRTAGYQLSAISTSSASRTIPFVDCGDSGITNEPRIYICRGGGAGGDT
jgi:hypothetical protein